MRNKFIECKDCAYERGASYGCMYCERNIENSMVPRHFKPKFVKEKEQEIRYDRCVENRKPVMVPVMFDEFALMGIVPEYYDRIDIKNVIFNDPATIVFWTDGTKTVVKAAEGDEFDPEKGIAMAISKKIFGNQGSYYNKIKKWTKPYYEKQEERDSSFKNLLSAFRKIASGLACSNISFKEYETDEKDERVPNIEPLEPKTVTFELEKEFIDDIAERLGYARKDGKDE